LFQYVFVLYSLDRKSVLNARQCYDSAVMPPVFYINPRPHYSCVCCAEVLPSHNAGKCRCTDDAHFYVVMSVSGAISMI